MFGVESISEYREDCKLVNISKGMKYTYDIMNVVIAAHRYLLIWPIGDRYGRHGPCMTLQLKFLELIFSTSFLPCNANMESLTAHRPYEEDTDEDLSDEQIRELLNEAAIRMRAKAAGKPFAASNVPFRLPKLNPGHIADTYETTEGLANGMKKIEDPLIAKKQRIEVCADNLSCYTLPVMIISQFFFLKQTRVPSWVPSCIIDALFHSYTEAFHHTRSSNSIHFQIANGLLRRRKQMLAVTGSTCLRRISRLSCDAISNC
jgi:hypothetical protein